MTRQMRTMAEHALTVSKDAALTTLSETGWAWWRSKLLAEPDWIAGVLLGIASTLVVFLVVIPRQEYAKMMRNPQEAFMARQSEPLTPEQAFRIQRARVSLRAGRVDQALIELETILKARPDLAEARWLYASTLDRLGDSARAAKHYALYLNHAERLHSSITARIQTAKQRLGVLQESP